MRGRKTTSMILAAVLAGLTVLSLLGSPATAQQQPPQQPPSGGTVPQGGPGGTVPPGGPPSTGQPGGGGLTAETAARDGLASAMVEAAVLAELGAWPEPLPPLVAEVHRRVDLTPYLDDLPAALEAADESGTRPLPALAGASTDVITVLNLLPAGDFDAAVAGETISIPADVYDQALADLAVRTGDAPAPGEPPADPTVLAVALAGLDVERVLGAAAPTTTEAPPSTAAADASVATPAPASGDDSGGPPWLVLVLGVLGGLILAALIVALVRRQSASSSDGGPDLVESARRLTRAGDVAEVEQLAVTEAIRLSGATGGALVFSEDGVLEVAKQSNDILLVPERLRDGLLGQVADTGQPVSEVSGTEPAVAQLPCAIAAVPMVLEGKVKGVLAVLRSDERPFTPEEVATVAKLAPIAASAIDNVARIDSMEQLALVDALTSLGNRRALDHDLERAVRASAADNRPVSVAMVDVDSFKTFNDTNGHAAGDEALRAVARMLVEGSRTDDTAYRYGGEEFCVVLTDTSEADAIAVAQRMRRAIEEVPVDGEATQPGGRVTASIGVATAGDGGAAELLRDADRALYGAKSQGRNRVVASSSLGDGVSTTD